MLAKIVGWNFLSLCLADGTLLTIMKSNLRPRHIPTSTAIQKDLKVPGHGVRILFIVSYDYDLCLIDVHSLQLRRIDGDKTLCLWYVLSGVFLHYYLFHGPPILVESRLSVRGNI